MSSIMLVPNPSKSIIRSRKSNPTGSRSTRKSKSPQMLKPLLEPTETVDHSIKRSGWNSTTKSLISFDDGSNIVFSTTNFSFLHIFLCLHKLTLELYSLLHNKHIKMSATFSLHNVLSMLHICFLDKICLSKLLFRDVV